jgi:UDP-glucose 4-epimerase
MLVTGGAGFIGSHLVEALVERGDRVRVLDNLSSGRLHHLDAVIDRIEFYAGDITDPPAVDKAVKGVDCVFHHAALASVPLSIKHPDQTHAVCATGTLNVLDSARRAGVRRLVYAASSSAYGNQNTTAKRESDLPAPISPYGAAKLAGEFYCQAFTHGYGFEAVALRYFNVFGPRQSPESPYSAVIPLFFAALLAGRRPVIYGDGGQSRDFVYVGNVVDANLLAADAPRAPGKVFNVGAGSATTLLELLHNLNQRLGTDIEPVFEAPRTGDVRESLADLKQSRALLNYEPRVLLGEGLDRSLGYYRDLVCGSGANNSDCESAPVAH